MMNAYPEYKPSGVEWLGKVPNHWSTPKISYLMEYIGSGTTPKTTNTEYYNGDIPWVTTGELREGVILDTKKKVTKLAIQDNSALKMHPVNSIVMAMYGATIGRLAKLGIKATTNQACCVLLPSKKIETDFLYYWLMCHRKEIIELSYGGGQPNISQDTVANLKVTLPPSDEQTEIVKFLNIELSRIDTLISEKENFIKLLQEKRQALISHVVTKGLDDNVKMKPSGVDWIGDIPTLWETSSLRWRIKIRSGDSLANDQFEKVSDDLNAIPVVGGNGLMAYTKQPNSYGSRIIIGRVGSHCGNVHKVNYPSWITDNALIVDTWNGFDQDFLIHLLRTLKINDLANKTALPLITGNQVKSIIVPIPPQEEQQEIVQFLHDKLSVIDQLIIETESSIKLLQEHRTALISAAVTGKIDVREVA